MNFAPFAFQNSQAVTYDSNAQAFFDAAGITNTTEKNAVNQLVLDLKSNSLWNNMFFIYPFVGGTSTTTSYNLKNTSQYQITWNGGITFSSTGVLSNGTSGYGNTGWNPKTYSLSFPSITSSLCLSVYSRTNNTNDGEEYGVASGQPAIQMLAKRTNGNAIFDNYNSTNGRIQTAVTNSQGLFTSSRTAQNYFQAFRNASQVGSDLTTNQNTADITTTLNYNLYVLAQNNAGSAASYSTRELAWMHAGYGLSSSQVSTLYTIVQNYQTALSRNV
jgi:hypothetical protein